MTSIVSLTSIYSPLARPIARPKVLLLACLHRSSSARRHYRGLYAQKHYLKVLRYLRGRGRGHGHVRDLRGRGCATCGVSK
jgi:hypothetical protein